MARAGPTAERLPQHTHASSKPVRCPVRPAGCVLPNEGAWGAFSHTTIQENVMTQTILSTHVRRSGFRHSQGLSLAAVGIAASLLTAAVMGGSRADIDPQQQMAAHAASPAAAVGMSKPASTTVPDGGSVLEGGDFPLQEPAPTF
jgi:hypothetical protein